jgi:hypothetical protein
MVLFEINAAGFAVLEFEGDTPWSIDVDRIASWIEPLQGMKVEAWNVHLFGPDGNIETVKTRENALVHFRIDLRTFAPTPKFRKRLAFEGSYHAIM